ncbi:hypothetical protein ASPFODRAFT_48825 [Aspergillus luchuensis CBS 106.47]|uniref:Uncharacterized protein n=1 Tax=Aspergillus luchuensis (strain CBS 106.47) TaxID=1137211 RepID=A0A1M3TDA3_ASPLC|nr:hypothetical protein ASPFODRAFT_48825 [Aspergillus luchuensis CBS 106.47]
MAKSDAGAGAGAFSCEGPAALQSETSNSDKNGVHYPPCGWERWHSGLRFGS